MHQIKSGQRYQTKNGTLYIVELITQVRGSDTFWECKSKIYGKNLICLGACCERNGKYLKNQDAPQEL